MKVKSLNFFFCNLRYDQQYIIVKLFVDNEASIMQENLEEINWAKGDISDINYFETSLFFINFFNSFNFLLAVDSLNFK